MVDPDDNAGLAYFEYLKKRSALSLLIRGHFFRPPDEVLSGRVLDVGCGIAEFSHWYRDEYIGLDHNPFLVRYNHERGLACIEGSTLSIPFSPRSFDGVVIMHVLEHLESPAFALEQIWQVLKSDGLLYITVPMRTGFQRDSTHKSYLDRQSLKRIAEEAGFSVVRLWAYPIPWAALGDRLYINEWRVLAKKVHREGTPSSG